MTRQNQAHQRYPSRLAVSRKKIIGNGIATSNRAVAIRIIKIALRAAVLERLCESKCKMRRINACAGVSQDERARTRIRTTVHNAKSYPVRCL